MFAALDYRDWLIDVALASFALLTVASLAVAVVRQPARRVRIIELALVGCVAIALLCLFPNRPRWRAFSSTGESTETGVLDSQVGRALASRLERKAIGQPDDLLQERLMYLEGEVERLSKEVGRLDDESEFLQQLLENRPGDAGALPPGDDPT